VETDDLMEGKGIVFCFRFPVIFNTVFYKSWKPYCCFLKYTEDPTTSLRKTSAYEKHLVAVRKESPGSTTATEGDDVMEGKGIVFFRFVVLYNTIF
jgi:hypothetical protein